MSARPFYIRSCEKGISCIRCKHRKGTVRVEGLKLHIDTAAYQIVQYDKILGILSSMVEQKAGSTLWTENLNRELVVEHIETG